MANARRVRDKENAPKKKSAVKDHMKHINNKIQKFRTETEIYALAEGLFRKDPSILQQMNEQLRVVPNARRGPEIRHFLSNKIETILRERNVQEGGIPIQPENYISYCDLMYLVNHLNQRVWHTFVLQDYPEDAIEMHAENGSCPLFKLRKRVKNILSKGPNKGRSLASVQAEVKELDDGDMVFLRITTTHITRNTKRDEERLMEKKPTFFVYFGGEPYFYTDDEVPDESHCLALVEALQCSGYAGIPLSGRNITSLRALRTNRDNPLARANANRRKSLANEALDENAIPVLDSFILTTNSNVRNDQGEMLGAMIPFSVEMKGSNVLAGLRELKFTTNVISSPQPGWFKKSVVRGRNEIKVKRPRPDDEENEDMDDDESEAQSACSDKTVLRRKSRRVSKTGSRNA